MLNRRHLQYEAYLADNTLAAWINWYGALNWVLDFTTSNSATMIKHGQELLIIKEPEGWFIHFT